MYAKMNRCAKNETCEMSCEKLCWNVFIIKGYDFHHGNKKYLSFASHGPVILTGRKKCGQTILLFNPIAFCYNIMMLRFYVKLQR